MANLIAGADGTLIDPSDREAVINAAEAVPGIEDQDINDGWLIEHTQTLDAGPGMMKYAITLPDGSPLECTPFQIEHRREMSKVWMATVRAQILQRAQVAADNSRAAALKAKRDKQMQGAGIQVASAIPSPEEAIMLAKIAAVQAPPPAPPESAREAIQQYKQHTPEMQKPPEGEADLKTAKRELAKAKANVAYWQAMIGSLQETEDEPSVGTASLTRAEKAVRTLQTSAVTTRK